MPIIFSAASTAIDAISLLSLIHISLIATTRREAVSPTHHNFNSKIYMNGNFYEEEPYNNIEVIDRIGSGDAYLAGVLYGLIKYLSLIHI